MPRAGGWDSASCGDDGVDALLRLSECVSPGTTTEHPLSGECGCGYGCDFEDAGWANPRMRRACRQGSDGDGYGLCAPSRALAARRAGRERLQWSTRAEAVQKMMCDLTVDDLTGASADNYLDCDAPLVCLPAARPDGSAEALLSASSTATRKRRRAPASDYVPTPRTSGPTGSDEGLITMAGSDESDCSAAYKPTVQALAPNSRFVAASRGDASSLRSVRLSGNCASAGLPFLAAANTQEFVGNNTRSNC